MRTREVDFGVEIPETGIASRANQSKNGATFCQSVESKITF